MRPAEEFYKKVSRRRNAKWEPLKRIERGGSAIESLEKKLAGDRRERWWDWEGAENRVPVNHRGHSTAMFPSREDFAEGVAIRIRIPRKKAKGENILSPIPWSTSFRTYPTRTRWISGVRMDGVIVKVERHIWPSPVEAARSGDYSAELFAEKERQLEAIEMEKWLERRLQVNDL